MKQKFDPGFSLYEHFGKFMGKRVQHKDAAHEAITKAAENLNLTTRFMPASRSQEDFGEQKDRLNVVLDNKTLVVSQITLG